MKFRFIKKVDKDVPLYNGQVGRTGTIIELKGNLAQKASVNKDYEKVGDDEPVTVTLPPVAVMDGKPVKGSDPFPEDQSEKLHVAPAPSLTEEVKEVVEKAKGPAKAAPRKKKQAEPVDVSDNS